MDFHIYRREDASQVFVAIKKLAAGISMNSFKLVHLLTASSELMSNMVKYAGNGTVTLSLDSREIRQKIVVVFNDKGPGIPDPELAMTPGYLLAKRWASVSPEPNGFVTNSASIPKWVRALPT